LPCPFHLLVDHLKWMEAYADARSLDVSQLPLALTEEGRPVTKEAMVCTFEEIAMACGEPLTDADGVRRYGGHSARVTGAQSLTAIGISIDKVKLLARHSSDALYRYVQGAPLQSIRLDLGLPERPSCSFVSASNEGKPNLKAVLERALHKISRLESQLEKLQVTRLHTKTVYIHNTETSSVHALHPEAQDMTACGWNFLERGRRRGTLKIIADLEGIPWWAMCERCLCSERTTRRDQSMYSLSDSD
jgi:hypothetical protein